MDKFFDIKKEFQSLIGNGWLTKEEAEIFMNDKNITKCMNHSTSPVKHNIFNALKIVPINSLKVVILGKDPYPNPNHAQGLAFSSLNPKTPASLRNIFITLDNTYGSTLYKEKKNNLINWAKSGVLLLNTWLTYEQVQQENLTPKEKKSLQTKLQTKHKKAWTEFINTILKKILKINNRPIVMLLWGNDAHDIVFDNIGNENFQVYRHDRGLNIIPDTSILILQSAHPSPLSINGDFKDIAPKHFIACDNHLKENKIIWTKL